MTVQDIIAAKRDGREIDPDEMTSLVLGFARGDIPDYQMSAFLMAAYIRGLTFSETAAMTRAMVVSGSVCDLSNVGPTVDKHSTGGVGDKTTLIVVPVLAACGLKVPKMSGRGLGFTGGTLDKLESIPGYTTSLGIDQVIRQVNDIGAAMAGQSTDIVPADKKIYALRDVTATADSIPLIAASIMSKKIACGSEVLILDVKVGSGAFMRDIEKARELARMMIWLGRDAGLEVSAVVSDMNQPLGRAVGNAVEVAEAIETLKGGGPADLMELSVQLSATGLYKAGQVDSLDEGVARAREALTSGAALEKFRQIVRAQGGDIRVIDDPGLLPQATVRLEVPSPIGGYVYRIDCERVGRAASFLGAGRERKEDKIDPAVGVKLSKKLGDRVESGEPIAVIFANDSAGASKARSILLESYGIGGDSAEPPPLIYEVIE